MLFFALTVLAAFTSVANAHFRLLYPEPRGAFVADQEPNFCGGYTDAVSNRSTFPLSGGFFTVKTGHPDWIAGVIISTVQNPRSFDNFSVNGQQQFISNYAKEADAGTFCIPLNISAANVEGVRDGSNVTIQIVFEGGDGNLYQCADLTLKSDYTIPESQATCSNATVDSAHHSDSSATASAAQASQSASSALGRGQQLSGFAAVVLGFGGIALALL